MKRNLILTAIMFVLTQGVHATLTAAQQARSAQLQQDIQLITPPSPPTLSPAMQRKMQARKVAFTANSDDMASMDSTQSFPVQNYGLVDLGSPGNYSAAYGINNSGQVVGTFMDSNYYDQPFLYSNGIMAGIGNLGGDSGTAAGISDNGQIVGYSLNTDDNAWHAFKYSNGTMQDLGSLLGNDMYSSSYGYCINNNGQIGGYSDSISYNQHAFLYNGGVMQDVNPFSAGYSQSYSINTAGEMVGIYLMDNGRFHSFLYANNTMTDIGTLSGGQSCYAYGINNSGQIVGYADTNDNPNIGHAFIYSASSGMQDIGSLGGNQCLAYGINNNGQVVGSANPSGSYNFHAFSYSGGTMQDLNGLLFSSDSTWTLVRANAVNDSGQIVGYGTDPDGDTHAFLLNPYLNFIYTGYKQFNADTSVVPAEFGTTVPAKDIAPGTSGNYAGGLAKTKPYGCALCSLAAMLTTVSGFESTTPATLNSKLIANGGYVEGCEMNWSAIKKVTGNALTRVDSQSGRVITASSSDQTALDQYLDNHCWGNRYRVILQLEANSDPNETHYIFVVGKANGDWIVFDPGWGNAYDYGTSNPDPALLSSLNGHLTGFTANNHDWKFAVVGVETYQINSPSNGSLDEVVHSPVELLMTDPNGNQVGYDSTTGDDVFQIPGASYTRDYPILDADQNLGGVGDTNGIKIISIPAPVGGFYSTVLIGTGQGSYTFDTSIVWLGNSQTNQTTTGMTDVGVITTNSVFVITPSVITSSSVGNGILNLSFTSQTNVTYMVQGVNSLLNTNWTSITNVTAIGTNADANVLMSDPSMMFYRVVSQ